MIIKNASKSTIDLGMLEILNKQAQTAQNTQTDMSYILGTLPNILSRSDNIYGQEQIQKIYNFVSQIKNGTQLKDIAPENRPDAFMVEQLVMNMLISKESDANIMNLITKILRVMEKEMKAPFGAPYGFLTRVKNKLDRERRQNP